MAHSFEAYIDEAGDEGFTFRPPPEQGSSQWFVIAAFVIRATREPTESRKLKGILAELGDPNDRIAHFSKLSHEARVWYIRELAKLPARVIAICFNKPALPDGHTLHNSRRMHFYAARLLLERISWIARDNLSKGEGDGKCGLTFSKCKNLSYGALGEYFEKLRAGETAIAWDHLDAEKARLSVLQADQSIWLRAADAVASGVYKGLELSRYGLCEDRYVRLLKPRVYGRKRWGRGLNYTSYGMKMMPAIPTPEKERDNRYEWLSLYK
jgi:hypothetical protein